MGGFSPLSPPPGYAPDTYIVIQCLIFGKTLSVRIFLTSRVSMNSDWKKKRSIYAVLYVLSVVCFSICYRITFFTYFDNGTKLSSNKIIINTTYDFGCSVLENNQLLTSTRYCFLRMNDCCCCLCVLTDFWFHFRIV